MISPPFAPVALFVFNRLEHTKRTINALLSNELAQETELYIFSDGPRNNSDVVKVEEIRRYLKNVKGFKTVTVINSEVNKGLSNSITSGLEYVFRLFDKVIVLEDDIVTSPFFLKYMNYYLDMYCDDPRVASVHGYVYPIDDLPDLFFLKGADCWGWGTWARAWNVYEPDGEKLLSELVNQGLEKECNFNNAYSYTNMLIKQINGENDSWAVRWYISTFLKNMLTLYPGTSLVLNIGNDDSGTHCRDSSVHNVEIATSAPLIGIEPQDNIFARKKFETFFRSLRPSLFDRIKRKVKCLLGLC